MKTLLDKRMSEILKKNGFSKKGETWLIDGTECVCAVDIQRSKWNGGCYINLGIGVKGLLPEKFIRVYQCHVNGRLDEIIKEKNKLDRLSKDPVAVMDCQYVQEVLDNFVKYGLPVLQSCTTILGLKTFLSANKNLNWAIMKPVLEAHGFTW